MAIVKKQIILGTIALLVLFVSGCKDNRTAIDASKDSTPRFENGHANDVYQYARTFCPKCKCSDVGEFFYGYYKLGENDSIDDAVRSHRLIPGGCVLNGRDPRYRCNSCYYEWGNYVH